jgi:hypothetical protein
VADPDRAFSKLRARVSASGSNPETQALFDEFLERHLDAYISQIERAAETDPLFARVVAETPIDQGASPARDRLRELQRRLSPALGMSRWEGFHPLPHDLAEPPSEGEGNAGNEPKR